MTTLRGLAGWSVRRVGCAGIAFRIAAASVLGVSGAVLCAQQLHDPANLAGERVRAVGTREIAANRGAAALKESLTKLRTRASLMMIVAHPDDEDGGMLTYESRGQGVHVATLTLTRGEGGQNLMSGDFDDALGLIRTQELLAADQYLGVDQMFGTEVDFGFSKTKEEAFAKWTHERVLYDAVRAVRLYRPLVITSVFVGGPTDGHGQHQVSGETAQEVFEAAGDAKVFPEMGLEPWKPLKVYARVPFARVGPKGILDYATNQYVPVRFYNYVTKMWTNEVPKANVTVHEGNPSALLGMSYVQFAREGLALQKTQIGEGVRLAPAGAFDVSYHRYGSRVSSGEAEQSFFDGIDVTLEGIATLAPSAASWLRPALRTIDGDAARAATVWSVSAPERCAPALGDGLKGLDALIAKVEASGLSGQDKTNVLHELRVKRVQFNDAMVQALGLRVEARMEAGQDGKCIEAVTPDCVAHVRTSVINGGKVEVEADFLSASGMGAEERNWASGTGKIEAGKIEAGKIESGKIETGKIGPGKTLQSFFDYGWPKESTVRNGRSAAPKDPITRPYFSRNSIEQPYYDVSDPALRLAPQTPRQSIWVRASYEGVPLEFGQVVLVPRDRPADADRPMTVIPALSVSITPRAGILPLTQMSLPVEVQIRCDVQHGMQGSTHLVLPKGWRAEPGAVDFAFHHAGEVERFTFRVTPAALAQKTYTLTAVAETAQGATREGFRAVGYPGLTPTNFYSSATYRTGGVDVKVAPGLKVGYLPGTGDQVQASLENIGVHATTLSVEDIALDRLGGYGVVVLGVRAYAANPGLAALNGRLLEYAKRGGVVIVQYNRGEFDFGPYPYTLRNEEKVVDETAPVTLLLPDSPVLNWPNRITARDFDGWVEERGHSFMESWDPRYEALLETHDPGQEPQRGGLLVAKTGKGVYVYVALALYRELPEGVPGAYRLFANLLSLGKTAN
ncbi:MAG: PIG-L family deacetylase [Acidobacteriota bacterium]|nr:PIG-L family deacetylase [Acidobacteriota bacterium]